jgi:hypothetical protein
MSYHRSMGQIPPQPTEAEIEHARAVADALSARIRRINLTFRWMGRP